MILPRYTINIIFFSARKQGCVRLQPSKYNSTEEGCFYESHTGRYEASDGTIFGYSGILAGDRCICKSNLCNGGKALETLLSGTNPVMINYGIFWILIFWGARFVIL